jgi:hypothetical protein
VAGGLVTSNVVFANPEVFELFDLPEQISFGQPRPVKMSPVR